MILVPFESHDSQLFNDPKIIKIGQVIIDLVHGHLLIRPCLGLNQVQVQVQIFGDFLQALATKKNSIGAFSV